MQGSAAKPMTVTTAYTFTLKKQYANGAKPVNEALFHKTSGVCLEALRLLTGIYLDNWEKLAPLKSAVRRGAAENLIHTTKDCDAPYKEFDKRFPYMPSYTRRAAISKALGIVSAYKSNHRNWEKADPRTRGREPVISLPSSYALTFYDQDRKLGDVTKGRIGLRLYNGKTWDWYCFGISGTDAKYLEHLTARDGRKLLSPTVEKIRGRLRIRFVCEEQRHLVQNEDPLAHNVLAVDLGINAPAFWCVMESDGTVRGRGVIRLPREEDRLRHLMNRKKMYQQAGKKSKCVYRWLNAANRALSIETARRIIRVAERYNADVIVFEYLDTRGKKHGGMKERLHLWRARDVQERVTIAAHHNCMRISRVCAWNTSRLAFDGSGRVDRHSVYVWKHGKKQYNYSLCTFATGKQYNCDLNASYNIGARYFLRAMAVMEDCPELPCVPQRTLNTLRCVVSAMKKAA